MDVIHFTEGATDPLRGFSARGAICAAGARSRDGIDQRLASRARRPRILVPSIIVFSACMRAVFGPEQPYAMAFEEGAIALIVEVLKASIDFGSDRAGKSARQTKTPVAMIAPA